MTTIAIAIQKGGSGKTTTAVNLGAVLNHLGKKVLLVDLDPQANLTQALGLSDELEPNMYHLLKKMAHGEEVALTDAIRMANDLDVVPSSLELAGAEMELISIFGRERLLQQLLKPVVNKYDFIIIDCPPALGMLTVNALTASDHVLLPLQAEFLPFKGVYSFLRSFEKIKKQLNPRIEVLGFILTKYDQRKNMNRQVSEKLKQAFGHQLFHTRIRSNIALAQAQEKGTDIFKYAQRSHGAQDYSQLGLEFLERISP